ncbi:quinon protein alcohol dehydrogenase-like superfamily [Pelagophyceae sp. CCMP2097]|nr:quinon protein alcohol dehydrogenase-like superfamily [Pelagophyceae sp. CCMP2097]
MSILVGDETGLVKVVDREKGEARLAGESFVQERRRSVLQLAFGDGAQRRLHCALKTGELETYVDQAGEWNLAGSSTGLKTCVALKALPGGNVLAVDGEDGRVTYSSVDGGRVGDQGGFETGGCVSAFDADAQRCVVGGKEHDVAVWCLETHTKLFRARNVKHDKLNLRIPIWVSALRFLDANIVVAGTMHHHLRVYDLRCENRRPVQEMKMEQAVRALAVQPNTALVGDVAGGVIGIDLRTMRLNARYRGPGGSVRALEVNLNNPRIFAAAGLDRHVHVWDTSSRTKEPVKSIYCKQRLNALVWLPEAEGDVVAALSDEEADDEDDAGDDDDDGGDF